MNLDRKTKLANDILPEKLELVKQVSDGYLAKQKILMLDRLGEVNDYSKKYNDFE
jgi:hypothetical protein